jgi:hypothetical protein
MVIDLLGPLISVRGQIRFQHLGPLEDFMFALWLQRADLEERLRALRAALNLLQRGFDERPALIAPIVYSTFDRLARAQMDVFALAREAWRGDAEKPDARFRPLLNLYATLYERFYPILIAPVISADAVLRTGENPADLIRDDGRVRLTAVERLETVRDYPPGLLTSGLNRHLRNSISHGRYDVLSRDRIRTEDRDPRTGELTWGPHELTYSELHGQVFDLNLTCRTLLATLVMFDVNNHDVIRARGYANPAEGRPRLDIIEATMQHWTDAYGFVLEEVREDNDRTLYMRFRVSGNRQERPVEIVLGGVGPVRRFIEDVTTEDVAISGQVYGVLQVSLDMHDTYEVVIVEVRREDGTDAGRLVVDRAARQAIFEGNYKFDAVRRVATEDTLSEDLMPVILRDTPRPI